MRKDKELREKLKKEKEEAAKKALEEKKTAPIANEYIKRIIESTQAPINPLLGMGIGGGAGEVKLT
jgi:hypothetical protein